MENKSRAKVRCCTSNFSKSQTLDSCQILSLFQILPGLP